MTVTTDPLAGPPDLADRCNRDGVFTLAARHWDARLRLELDDGAQLAALDVRDGRAAPASDAPASGEMVLRAPRPVFADLLAAVPPPGCSDLGSARARGLVVDGSEEAFAQYYGAIARVVDLCREAAHGPAASAGPLRPQRSAPTRPNDSEGPRFDSPVGRYLHVELDGVDHRIYVETAGHGVPLLLQHTAGAHGAQWRHLFEDPWITDRFQLVAYDLPFHGKSLPPTSVDWWANPYRLTLERFMAVPLAVADGLGLVDPVFMGCSIGGLLALDLARYHPDRFRAVIGVEPALRVHGRLDHMTAMWHPRVDSGYKAALMEGLVAPQSPEAYRKETAFVYAQGWPPAFLGDLHYYVVDHDLRQEAAAIDTSQVAVHLLGGAYDWSATPEMGRMAHEAVEGSTWVEMEEVGHFPMSENPERFLGYLRPVLGQILA